MERGEDELVPGEVVYAILNGENPLKVWREYRGMTQPEIAEEAGISVPYLSQLETNKRKGQLMFYRPLPKFCKFLLKTSFWRNLKKRTNTADQASRACTPQGHTAWRQAFRWQAHKIHELACQK